MTLAAAVGWAADRHRLGVEQPGLHEPVDSEGRFRVGSLVPRMPQAGRASDEAQQLLLAVKIVHNLGLFPQARGKVRRAGIRRS